MASATVSVAKRLEYYIACALAQEPIQDLEGLTPADEVRIFDNSPRRIPSVIKFRSAAGRPYTDYLSARMEAFALGESFTTAKLRGIVDPVGEADGALEERFEGLVELFRQQRPGEEQALVRRLAQLPREVVVAEWYYDCDGLVEWIANVQAADAERETDVWRTRFDASYTSVLNVANADPTDADAQRVLDALHADFSAVATALQEHLRGTGSAGLDAASSRLGTRPFPAPSDVGQDPPLGSVLLTMSVAMAKSTNSFSDGSEILAHFVKALTAAVGCAWADFLKADDDGRLTPVAISVPDGKLGAGYRRAQGITGSAVLLPEPLERRWVGTNRLIDDPRQSPAHTKAYSEEHDYPSDYWVFPVFDGERLFGAFRVVNRQANRTACGVPWSGFILRELREVATWFEAMLVPRLTYKPRTARSPAEAAHSVAARAFQSDCNLAWVGESFLVKLLAHITSVAHRRVEKNSLGCTIGVFAEALSGPVQTYLGHYFPIGMVGFDDLPSEDHLELAASYYESVDPGLGMFVFDNAGYGKGVALVQSLASRDAEWQCTLTETYTPALILSLERGQDCMRLFTEGRAQADYYLSDAAGVWTPRSYPEIEKKVLGAAPSHLSDKVLRDVLARAFELSHRRLGAMLIVGGPIASAHLSRSRPLTNGVLLAGIGERMFADVARLDGAVHITPDGVIMCNGAIVRTGSPGGSGTPSLGGGRHAAAESFSAMSPEHVVVVVSENRTVSVLVHGQYLVSRR